MDPHWLRRVLSLNLITFDTKVPWKAPKDTLLVIRVFWRLNVDKQTTNAFAIVESRKKKYCVAYL